MWGIQMLNTEFCKLQVLFFWKLETLKSWNLGDFGILKLANSESLKLKKCRDEEIEKIWN